MKGGAEEEKRRAVVAAQGTMGQNIDAVHGAIKRSQSPLKEIIRGCLKENPEERLSIEDALQLVERLFNVEDREGLERALNQ